MNTSQSDLDTVHKLQRKLIIITIENVVSLDNNFSDVIVIIDLIVMII